VFDYRQFFELGEGSIRGALRVHALGLIPDPVALTRGEIEPEEPVRFHHDRGGRLKDYIGTTWGVLDIVSDRVVAALRDGGFTGWTTYAVEIFDEHGGAVPGFHGLAATGRSGPIVKSLSPLMHFPVVPGGRPVPQRVGIRFDPETWDGNDVFMPEGTAWKIVTQPVRDALLASKVTNIRLQRITEIEMSDSESEDS
jgi:hypothetical protein